MTKPTACGAPWRLPTGPAATAGREGTVMELSGGQLIGYAESGEGPASFAGVDPRGRYPLAPRYREASEGEIERALAAAEAAFDGYRNLPSARRAAFLRAAADEIEGLGERLVERVMAETALPAARVRGERGRTTGQLRAFADLLDEGSWVDARIDPADPGRQPQPKPDLRRMLIPIGPVVVFGASNFPLAFSTAGGDTASALAAGCPVVVKAHPAHPGTSELVARALLRAARAHDLPDGVLSLLHGPRPATGVALVRHPLTRAVGFTGSWRAGRALMDAAAARPEPIPVYAEMGSVNPFVVLPNAAARDLEGVATLLYGSCTLGVGQFCTQPGLVLALEADARALAEALGRRAAAAAAEPMLYDGLAEAYGAAVERRAGAAGVELVARASQGADGTAAPAVLYADGATALADPGLFDEVFGPVTLVVGAADPETLSALVAGLPGQLTATVHAAGDDLADHVGLVRALERKVGRLLFGGVPTGVEVLPAMQHGGPYPASSDVRSTSVGTAAIVRFARPICYQDAPDAVLPVELRDGNPAGILRLVDGTWTRS
jgi:2,5-dioxopentanoate dehydrogenase